MIPGLILLVLGVVFSSTLEPDEVPSKSEPNVETSKSPASDAPTHPGQSFIAFGDWGHQGGISILDLIHAFIKGQCEASTEELEGIFLLGDNFYPVGISPALGVDDPQFDLFSEHLAGHDLPDNIVFFSVLGNHDYLQNGQQAQIEYSKINPQWVMQSRTYMVEFPIGPSESNDDLLCMWFVDSISFSDHDKEDLEISMISAKNCRWRIILTHYPVITAGTYRDDSTVSHFRQKIQSLLGSVDFVIAGHEHSAQSLTMDGLKCRFLIAGSPVDIRLGSVTQNLASQPIIVGGQLEWFNDSNNGIVLKLIVTRDSFEYKFVQIYDNSVVHSGTVPSK